ncbi:MULTISPECIES: SGNH/GDSL hydrolase family protein [Nonomuraea]|uniref:SGNH/GDSL hydrolase family protein n=2 Tax=Nonomuraea TaxID=83681 RepID=A0ABN3SZE5_9ACTN|nr:SGNH/GDSL hydrolase family protein [Nonomuraea dietziae]
MMFVGDSFTVGSGPVRTWQTYASESARQLGWQPVIAGAGGTGFVNEGRVGRTFEQSFMAELAWRPAPDLLVISGGHNDSRWPAATVRQAAARLVWSVKAHWPGTRIVMVGPIWIDRAPPSAYLLRDALAEVAARERVAFLDPLARRWIEGRRSEVLLPDGVHPTLGGHHKLARWLAGALQTTSAPA